VLLEATDGAGDAFGLFGTLLARLQVGLNGGGIGAKQEVGELLVGEVGLLKFAVGIH
jgi:hypothetical protein